MEPISISILDDHQIVVNGVEAMLKPYEHIRVVSTFLSGAALLQALEQSVPDVLLLDIILPDLSGKELVVQLKAQYPGLKILALTSLDAPAMISSMLRRGCSGYLLKGVCPDTLALAIETVHRGGEFLDPAVKDLMVSKLTKFRDQSAAQNAIVPVLTQREKEILQLIAEEYTTKDISEKLFISYRTAENHRHNLIQKLDVKNTAGLVKMAIQLGLI
jgi:DNA-binding NarL/FixJ family response regulator